VKYATLYAESGQFLSGLAYEWVWNQLTGLTTPHAYACRKPGHEIPLANVVSMFNDLR
jgi:hypothetical protein